MHTLMIIPKSLKPQADGFGLALLRKYQLAGTFAFTVPLYSKDATDDATFTYYWSGMPMTDAVYSDVQAALGQFPGADVSQYDPETQRDAPDKKLASLNLRRAKSMINI